MCNCAVVCVCAVIIFHVLAQFIVPEWHIFLNFGQPLLLL
jgi:hypothetical protein